MIALLFILFGLAASAAVLTHRANRRLETEAFALRLRNADLAAKLSTARLGYKEAL